MQIALANERALHCSARAKGSMTNTVRFSSHFARSRPQDGYNSLWR